MTVPMGYDDLAQRMEYTYDISGRLIGMDVVDTKTTSSTSLAANAGSGDETKFYYNTDQNRVKVINKAGDAFYYVYDPTASIPAVLYEQGPATGGRPGAGYRYVNIREPDGSLLRRDRYVESGGSLALDQTRTYHFDGLGSTLVLTDGSGVITDKFSYDAWGNVTRVSGSTNDNPYLYVGQLGYYTHYQEPTMNPLDQTSGTKLLQLGVRYYDPEIGRFTQRDAIAKRWGAYVYADNNALSLVDPEGLTPIEDCFNNYSGKKIPDKIKEKLKSCLQKTPHGSEELGECIDKIPTKLGRKVLCEVVACALYNEKGHSEGQEKHRGYPCDDPRSKTEAGYCHGCAEWKKTVCLCENLWSPINGIACKSKHDADGLKCDRLGCQ